MPYIPHTPDDIARMLRTIGAESFEALLDPIPAGLRCKQGLGLAKGLSEQELKDLLTEISSENRTVGGGGGGYSSFLGGGAYNHYIPSVVAALTNRSEFATSYTPYQPEISQGTLQAIFEYQTLICQLTAMDAANASLYDGASAVAEAALMARRITGGRKVLLSSTLHPEYRATVATYLGNEDILEVGYCAEQGVTLEQSAEEALAREDPACLVIQSPNFFGSIEDIGALSALIHKRNGLLIAVVTEPLSLALLTPPGETGADIVVGEAHSFGSPMNLGGPHLGFMGVREENLRQMPGRVVGQTKDSDGERAFCLTLATREQHIRRDRATSNICTNEGLSALGAAVYLSALGKGGMKELARLNLSKAEYLKLAFSNKGIKTSFTSPTFNEFVVDVGHDPERSLKAALDEGIIGGLALNRFYPDLATHLLITVTEMNSRQEMDRLARALGGG